MKDVIFDEQKQTEKSSYNPDVLSCLANLSNDEVFTPPEVANAMLDMLPQEIFSNRNVKFLDPACKSGVFLREIAKRLLVGLEKEIPDLQERVTHIFKKQLFAIAITELTSLLSRRSVYCSKDASGKYSVTEFTNSEGNIFYKPAKHLWINGKCLHCGASQKEYGEEQKQEGIQTGRRTEIYLSVQDGDYSVQRGAEKAGLSLEEFKKSMSEAGYKLPEPV